MTGDTWPLHARRADVADALMLAAIVAVLAAVNYAWLSTHSIPPHWDQASHMRSALAYHEVLSTCMNGEGGMLRGLARCGRAIMFVDQFVYGPLFPLLAGVMIFAAGNSITALAMTNVPFLALLVASMYGLGRQLHSRAAGVLAALLVCAYPLVFTASREFMFELPLLAFTAASACLLVLSNGFAHRMRTVLFGIAAGLAVLIKVTYLPFIVGPLLLEVGRLVHTIRRGRVTPLEGRRRLTSVALASVAALALAALWYLPNRNGFVAGIQLIRSLDTLGTSPFAPASLAYYARAMIWDQMGVPLFAIFVYGLLRIGRMADDSRRLLLIWMVSIYASATLADFKAPHNDIGILIPAALISAAAVSHLARGRGLARAGVAALACVQLATFSLPAPVLASHVGTFGWSGASRAFPRTEDWRFEDVLVSLSARPARVVVLSDHPYVNGTTAQFYADQHRLPLHISPCWALPLSTDANFSAFDFVIAKSDAGWVRPKGDGCFLGPSGRAAYEAVLQSLRERPKRIRPRAIGRAPGRVRPAGLSNRAVAVGRAGPGQVADADCPERHRHSARSHQDGPGAESTARAFRVCALDCVFSRAASGDARSGAAAVSDRARLRTARDAAQPRVVAADLTALRVG